MPWTEEHERMAIDLIDRLQRAPQRTVPVAGRGDHDPIDEYRIVVSAAERNLMMRALDFLDTFNRGHRP